jgi:hypothetical protein
MITTFVVFFLVGSLSRRFVARFPNGEKLVGPEAAPEPQGDSEPKAAPDAG